ncbi:hypothetical protein A7981_06905 [Methylovorus sp. MM2]|uniref:MraY family glycosyltransferase n=1 Tax=Methylovorus sp. MM2 TaxID=1848038 RepID=UPI0007E0C664|nr:glycosyltransferase family 4 protein [Methylovorus sp. MM2]OAM53135.1 hypothetical protein A7981_06905 [Methylovorus sp. MM2]
MIDVIFSFSLTLLGLFLLLKTKLKFLATDKPNNRSLHTKITPRTGGLAMMFGVLITWVLSGVSWEWLLLPLVLIAISLIDDIRGLKARWRFLAQIVVCSVFLALHPSNVTLWVMPLLLLAMVWMVNLYNFMDGSDGLAGGMAFFGFSTYAIAAYISGHSELVMLCASLASASLAFLIFNFYPAKIFMGDSGSIPLGFFASAIGLWGWQQSLWPFWFPILVFSPFIVDATVTLIKRLFAREKVWEAHRNHYYQRIVQMGWGHAKTAIVEYVLMLGISISSLIAIKVSQVCFFVFISWAVVYVVLIRIIDGRWNDFSASR